MKAGTRARTRSGEQRAHARCTRAEGGGVGGARAAREVCAIARAVLAHTRGRFLVNPQA